MNKTIETVVKVIEFLTVQVIPFADLIIKTVRKWKKEKDVKPVE